MERVQTRSMFLTDAPEGSPGFTLRLSGVCVPGRAAERGSSEAGRGCAPEAAGAGMPARKAEAGISGRIEKTYNHIFHEDEQ